MAHILKTVLILSIITLFIPQTIFCGLFQDKNISTILEKPLNSDTLAPVSFSENLDFDLNSGGTKGKMPRSSVFAELDEQIFEAVESVQTEQLIGICRDHAQVELETFQSGYKKTNKFSTFLLLNLRNYKTFDEVMIKLQELYEEGYRHVHLWGGLFQYSTLSRKMNKGEKDDEARSLYFRRDPEGKIRTVTKNPAGGNEGSIGSPFAIPDYLQANPEKGGNEGLDKLLQKAKDEWGMTVTFDIVAHGTAIDSPYLVDESLQEKESHWGENRYWYIHKGIGELNEEKLRALEPWLNLPDENDIHGWERSWRNNPCYVDFVRYELKYRNFPVPEHKEQLETLLQEWEAHPEKNDTASDFWNEFVDRCHQILEKSPYVEVVELWYFIMLNNPNYFLHYSTRMGKWILVAHPKDHDLKEKGESWMDLAALDITNPAVRRMLINKICTLIRKGAGGIRADSAMTSLKGKNFNNDGLEVHKLEKGFYALYLREHFQKHPDNPTDFWFNVYEEWPEEFWSELIREVKKAYHESGRQGEPLLVAEAYWITDVLTECGFDHIWHTDVRNMLERERNLIKIKDDMAHKPMREQNGNLVTLQTWDEDLNRIRDMCQSQPERAARMMRNMYLVIMTMPGVPGICNEQREGYFRVASPHWNDLDKVDHPRREVKEMFEELHAIAQDPVFRESGWYLFKQTNYNAHANANVLAFARHRHDGRRALMIWNQDERNTLDAYLNLKEAAGHDQLNLSGEKGKYYVLCDRLTGETRLYKGEDLLRDPLFLGMKPDTAHCFMIHEIQDNDGLIENEEVFKNALNNELTVKQIYCLLTKFYIHIDYPVKGRMMKALSLFFLERRHSREEVRGLLSQETAGCLFDFTGRESAEEINTEIERLRQEGKGHPKIDYFCNLLRMLNTDGSSLKGKRIYLNLMDGETHIESDIKKDLHNQEILYVHFTDLSIRYPETLEGIEKFKNRGVLSLYKSYDCSDKNLEQILKAALIFYNMKPDKEKIMEWIDPYYHEESFNAYVIYLFLKGEIKSIEDMVRNLPEYYEGSRGSYVRPFILEAAIACLSSPEFNAILKAYMDRPDDEPILSIKQIIIHETAKRRNPAVSDVVIRTCEDYFITDNVSALTDQCLGCFGVWAEVRNFKNVFSVLGTKDEAKIRQHISRLSQIIESIPDEEKKRDIRKRFHKALLAIAAEKNHYLLLFEIWKILDEQEKEDTEEPPFIREMERNFSRCAQPEYFRSAVGDADTMKTIQGSLPTVSSICQKYYKQSAENLFHSGFMYFFLADMEDFTRENSEINFKLRKILCDYLIAEYSSLKQKFLASGDETLLPVIYECEKPLIALLRLSNEEALKKNPAYLFDLMYALSEDYEPEKKENPSRKKRTEALREIHPDMKIWLGWRQEFCKYRCLHALGDFREAQDLNLKIIRFTEYTLDTWQWSNQVSTLHSALDDILAMQNAGFTLKKDTLDKIMAWEQKMRRYDSAHARIAQIIRNHRYYARKHFVLHDWEQRDASHKPALSVLSRLTTSQAVESFARKHQGVPALRKYVLIRKLELVVEDKYMLRQMLEWLNLLLPPNEVEAAENNPMIQLCLRDEVSVCLHGAEDTLQLLLTFAVHTRVRGQGNQRRFMIEFNELFKKIAVHFQDQFDREKIQGLMALIGYQIRNTSSFMTLTSLNHFVDFLFDVSTNIQSRHHSRTFTLPQLLSALTALNSLIFDPDSLNTEIISLQMILDGCIDDFESMEDVVAAMYILWEAQKGNDYILLDQRGVDAAMLSAQLKTRRESREQPRPEQVELDPTVRAA